jgi:uncharacterized phiE125 gp8 family phage protein
MAIRWEGKRPGEVRVREIDWSVFLDGETIATSDVTVEGITLDSDTNDDTTVTVVLSGGTEGTLARITNTIETSGGRTEVELFTLYISAYAEPVTLAEAKRQCRMVEDDSQDDFLCDLIAPARAYCERRSHGHVFMRRSFTDSFSRWGDYLEVWRRPIFVDDDNPITVAYTDEAGTEAEYEGFLAPVGRHPLRVYPGIDDEFPGLGSGGAISVTYTAGYPEGSQDEAMLIGKRAMLLLIGHWFENREGVVVGQASHEVELAVQSMLDELRHLSVY